MHTTRARTSLRSASTSLSTTLRGLALGAGLALGLATAACATTSGPRPVNVAAVRHQIDDAITAQGGGRAILSMGRVAAGRAVVYTTAPGGARHEEVWVKDGAGWRLLETTALDAGPTAPATGARSTR